MSQTVFVLIGADGEVLGVHPTSRRAQRDAEKRERRTLAWAASDDPQYHRTSEDYRVTKTPAYLAPEVGGRPLRVL